MAITNSQQARQMYNQGGYADMGLQAPRQNYGLGKFVKKAIRGVKKIAKSPLGKAALIAGGGYMLGGAKFMGGEGMFAGNQGLSRFGNIGRYIKGGLGNFMDGTDETKMGGLSNLFRKREEIGNTGKYGTAGNAFSMGKLALGGLGAASLAPLLMGGKDDVEEEVGEVMDPSNITNRARNYYSGLGQKGVGLDFMPQKKYVQGNFYAADGGRAGYAMGGDIEEDEDEMIRMQAAQRIRPQQTFLAMGGGAGNAQAEQMLQAEFIKYKNKGGDLSFTEFVQAVMQQQQQSQGMEQPTMMAANGGPVPDSTVSGYTTPAGYNKFDYTSGGVRVNAAEGGIMDTEQAEMIDMGGQEKDYRDEGGFVAMGGEERADDVPARLSKNEFVFTADAVRSAGGGDIDKGSEVMQNMMDNLEQGGQISQGSQGMGGEEMISEEEMIQEPDGAQAMYDQQAMLQSRMA